MTKKLENRIWFAQMLRGLACLSVCYEHLFRRFWVDSDFRISVTKNPNLPLYFENNFLMKINHIFNYLGDFNIGSFGVGIFFLISGFVIPFSVEKKSSTNFLIHRFFRIFPVYIVSSLFSVAFLYFFNHHSTLSFTDIIANLALFPRMLLNKDTIDPASWTLLVECSFYLLILLASRIGNIRQPKTLLLMTFFVSITPVFIMYGLQLKPYIWPTRIAMLFQNISIYITFIIIGTCFYNLHIKAWSKEKFTATTLFLAILFLSQLSDYKMMFVLSYGAALIVFGLCYFYQNKLKYNAILDFFSNISYSLYLNHQILGLILMSIILELFPSLSSIDCIATFLICLLFASIIYNLVEKPFLKLSKSWQ